MTAAAGVEQALMIQPLLDAGVPVEDLQAMLFEVAFAAFMGDRELDVCLRTVVAGRPAAVQAAWIETISRMIASPAAGGPTRPGGDVPFTGT